VSYSNFGNPDTEHSRRVAGAVNILDARADVDFEYEGEMTPRVALDERAQAAYPFSRLNGPANVLVTPGIHSASISTKLLAEVGGAIVLGPLLIGLEKPVQIAPVGARVPDIVTLAALAAYNLDTEHRSWAEKAG
jgi:malate dehydrogenase (oxaloacetate-decarboxylating)(NADP+)